MTLTFANVTTANSTTSNAALTTAAVSVSVGDWLLVCVGADNNGSGGAVSLSGITDQAGNRYNEVTLVNYDPGAASAGITLGVYLARVSTALSSQTISANFSPNTAAKAMTVQRITLGDGERIAVIGTGAGVTGGGTAMSAGAVTVTNGDTIIGATALENTAAAVADSDTTNGSWSTAYSDAGSTGTVATSASITTQYKTVTATGSQTYNTSTASSVDFAVNYTIIRAVPQGYWSVNGGTIGV